MPIRASLAARTSLARTLPYTEGLVDKFCNWYLNRLGAGLDKAGSAHPLSSAPNLRAGTAAAARTARRAPGAAPDAAPTAAPTAAPATAPDARQFSITFRQSGHVVPCRTDQTILSAAESAGLPLPFSCREGRCGTCRSRLLAGQVDMKHAGGIRQRQIDLGDILVCCSRPLSDVVIEK